MVLSEIYNKYDNEKKRKIFKKNNYFNSIFDSRFKTFKIVKIFIKKVVIAIKFNKKKRNSI